MMRNMLFLNTASGWRTLLAAAVLAAISACSSVEPQPYYDHREEGPRRGMISGEQGGFVIYRNGNDDG